MNVPTSIIDIGPNFTYQSDTLNISNKTLLQFIDVSTDASSYSWRLDENEFSTEANPITDILALDTLAIELYITNEVGCSDSLTHIISFETPQPPLLNDTFVCTNDSILIKPELDRVYYYYSDVALNNLIYKGRSLKLNPINTDTLFYVTSVNGNKESTSERIDMQCNSFHLTPTLQLVPIPSSLKKAILSSFPTCHKTGLPGNGISMIPLLNWCNIPFYGCIPQQLMKFGLRLKVKMGAVLK